MRDDVGKLLLRVSLGIVVLLHGIAKLRNGVSGIEGMLVSAGMPGWLAYGVYIGEVLAPIMLIIGFYARIGAVLVAVNMLFAVGLAHSAQVFQLTRSGGWALELQGMLLFAAVALVFLGPGRYSINRS